MTSRAHRTESVSAVFYPAVFFRNSRALNSITSYEKNQQVRQADVFKQQTLMFIFQHIFHIHLSIYPSVKSTRVYQLLRCADVKS